MKPATATSRDVETRGIRLKKCMKYGELIVTPNAEDNWTLRLERDGEKCCRVELARKRMRIGRSRISTGGIAGLYTPPDRRMEGHARGLMEASHDFLRQQGCSVVLLNAIPDFYHRFGYDVVFPVYRLFVKTNRLLQARRPLHVRRALKRDEPALVRHYNQCNRYRSGTLVRHADWRFDNLVNYGRPAGTLLQVEDRRRRVAGYALCRTRPDRYFVQELNARSSAAFESLANAIGTRARRAGFNRVHFKLSIDHPFGEFSNRFGSEWEIQHHVNAEGMGRVLDLPRFLASLRTELAYRLGKSMWSENACLWIVTEMGAAGLKIAGNGVRCIRSRDTDAWEVTLPQTVLLQLALGYRTVLDAANKQDVRVPRLARPLLDILFPPSPAMMPLIVE